MAIADDVKALQEQVALLRNRVIALEARPSPTHEQFARRVWFLIRMALGKETVKPFDGVDPVLVAEVKEKLGQEDSP